ncbi:hypothetical protein SAMN05660477_01799 [Soonwooa buanensis]|uniref:Uncharacterized protein n=2 Tax=Soonwooa buanensis TaxID=619805 RepID=A0A1T5F5M5_9FLAO|nr:hypothetical protein SAMN05660477_01799 [Soonwooa buanensis]
MTQSKFYFLIFFISHIFLSANMAKPTVDGTTTSTLFGSKDCTVIKEKIDLKLTKDHSDYIKSYLINYKITYKISSPKKEKLDLVFVGINMMNSENISVNGTTITASKIKKFPENFKDKDGDGLYELKFDQANTYYIPPDDAISFVANLEAGENEIIIEYNGYPEYNVFGILREFKIEYALYPSKFWKSFGPIEVNINMPNDTEIRSVNQGALQDLKNGNYQLKIDKIVLDDLEINFSTKLSILGKILLFIQPIGLTCISFLILAFLHFKWIKNTRKRRPKKFNYSVILGSLLVITLCFFVFIFGHDLILWVINEEHMKQGYILLAVFTYPIFLIIYLMIAWYFDATCKMKLNE